MHHNRKILLCRFTILRFQQRKKQFLYTTEYCCKWSSTNFLLVLNMLILHHFYGARYHSFRLFYWLDLGLDGYNPEWSISYKCCHSKMIIYNNLRNNKIIVFWLYYYGFWIHILYILRKKYCFENRTLEHLNWFVIFWNKLCYANGKVQSLNQRKGWNWRKNDTNRQWNDISKFL